MTIDDMFPTPEEMFDAKDEARHRHPNWDANERLNSLYETYLNYYPNKIMQEQIQIEIDNTFKTMIFLEYSLNCMKYYKKIWDYTQEQEGEK